MSTVVIPVRIYPKVCEGIENTGLSFISIYCSFYVCLHESNTMVQKEKHEVKNKK